MLRINLRTLMLVFIMTALAQSAWSMDERQDKAGTPLQRNPAQVTNQSFLETTRKLYTPPFQPLDDYLDYQN